MTGRTRRFPTSERVAEEYCRTSFTNYVVYLFHIATYDFARPQIAGGRVLDFGCGTGYGASRISGECREIIGVDISADAIAIATERYDARNLQFKQIGRVEDGPIPFATSSFDAVLSFQVIEHIAEPRVYLREIVRVLRPGGVAIIATPDRRTRLRPRQRPWNRFHVTEYDPKSLEQLIAHDFDQVQFFTMSAERVIFERELQRTQRLRRFTYPFTFPGAPDLWRQFGLRSLKLADTLGQRLRLRQTPSEQFDFDESVITIHPGRALGLNIVAVAHLR